MTGNGVFEYRPDLKNSQYFECRNISRVSGSQVIPLKFSVKMDRYPLLLRTTISLLVLVLDEL